MEVTEKKEESIWHLKKPVPTSSIEYALIQATTQPYNVSQLPVDHVDEEELNMSLWFPSFIVTVLGIVVIWSIFSMWRCRKDMNLYTFWMRTSFLITIWVVSFFV